ncbi:MAG: hypothetical protein EA422_04755 [Gemmatimonadales bacterium]|nr:MAG: hypothetical protein EA422_04755 [Gemmatimonadales bacterium]
MPDNVKPGHVRPLNAVYPILDPDVIHVKMRPDGHVQTRAIYLALAVIMSGEKELLGLWVGRTALAGSTPRGGQLPRARPFTIHRCGLPAPRRSAMEAVAFRESTRMRLSRKIRSRSNTLWSVTRTTQSASLRASSVRSTPVHSRPSSRISGM